MSFRKRNVGLSRNPGTVSTPAASIITHSLPGLRPSPLDGRATTSTGTPTLDSLLAGHAGLPMGASMLIEENGTTDYAGALLRYYTAEGLVQGHRVYVLGVPEPWGRDLPGLIDGKEKEKPASNVTDKMKIAWRYERLGQPANSRGGRSIPCDSIALDQYRTSVESVSVRQNRMADFTSQNKQADKTGKMIKGELPSKCPLYFAILLI
jgi:elongator complex protein 4